jgi:nicotinamide-nucleotide adenylyltransferase
LAAIDQLLAGLVRPGPPRAGFVRRAPAGIRAGGCVLLCLSASFNPITVAHLALLQTAESALPPDESLLLLSVANVDKAPSGLPLPTRVRILEAVAAAKPGISVALASHGRFLDKAQALRAHYPPDTRCVFVVGFDTLVRLFDPRYYDDLPGSLAVLFAASEFVAANRQPAPPEALRGFLRRPEVAPYAHRIHPVTLPAGVAAISATEVRRRLRLDEPLDALVPAEALPLLRAWGAASR